MQGLDLQRELRIVHQCGQQHLAATEADYQQRKLNAEVKPFIDDMAASYAWADIVICRAGELTIAELAATGVASILVPFPYAVDDHQTANARYLSDAEAAILIQESELSVEKLKDILITVFRSPDQLLQMAVRARSLARPEATETVASLCVEAAHA